MDQNKTFGHPSEPGILTPQQISQNDESVYPCQICTVTDNQPIVCCDGCNLWFHFECANAPIDVADYDWFCIECRQIIGPPVPGRKSNTHQNPIGTVQQEPENMSVLNPFIDEQNLTTSTVRQPISSHQNVVEDQRQTNPSLPIMVGDQQSTQLVLPNHPTRSHKAKSNNTTSTRKRSLALQRLEEERKLEIEEQVRREQRNKEYLDKKYSLLEQEASDDDSLSLSFDDEEVAPLKSESIKRWAENARRQVNTGTKEAMVKVFQSSSKDTNQKGVEQVVQSNWSQKILDDQVRQNPSQVAPQQTKTQNLMDMPVPASLMDHQGLSVQLSQSSRLSEQASLTANVQQKPSDKIFGLRDINQSSMGSQPTSQVAKAQLLKKFNQIRNQFGYPPIQQHDMRNKDTPFVGMQTFNDQRQQRPSSIATQTLVKQPSNEGRVPLVTSQPNTNQKVTANKQPPISNSQNSHLFIGHNQKPGASNQPFVTTSQSSETRSRVNLNQAPVMSTSVYQSNSNRQQIVSSNQPIVSYYQPIVSTHQSSVSTHQSIVSTHQIIVSTFQPFVSNHQRIVSTHRPFVAYHQPIPYHQPIVSNQGPIVTDHQPIISNHRTSASNDYYQPISSNNNYYQQSGSTEIPNPTFSINQPYVSNSSTFGHRQYTPINYNNYAPIGSLQTNQSTSVNNGNMMTPGRLTAEQIAARHVMPRDLPYFNGDPTEWLKFISAYENSNETCGFSNSENLGRLQKCLKGDSETLVKGRLVHKDSVPGVIETLRLLYGRPELIIETMNLEAQEHLRNPTLINSITDKLPSQHQLTWAFQKKAIGDVHIGHLGDWLYQIAEVASQVVRVSNKSNTRKSDKSNDKGKAYVNVHMDGGSERKESNSSAETSKNSKKPSICITCGKGCQKLENCPKFNSFSLDRKYKEVKDHKLCRLCLKKHKFPCKLSTVCGKDGCSFKHHQSLHNDEKQTPSNNTVSASNNVHQDSSGQVLLKYGPVALHVNNKKVITFAFFDDGSQASMLEQNLADELGISGTKEELCLLWTENIHRKEQAQRISIEISGLKDSDHRYPLNGIRAVRSLHLPSQTFKKADFVEQFPHLANIPLDDYENAVPGILIASDFPKLGIQLKVVESKEFNSPIAQKTRLGWSIYGPCGKKAESHYVNNHHVVQVCQHHNRSDNEIHQQVKEYFSIENFGVRANPNMELESKDNQRALYLLNNLTKKVGGRYETGLLWKTDNINKHLPDSYPMAMKRLMSLEKQSKGTVQLIGAKINEYVAKGYARKLSEKEVIDLGDEKWYLPVFGVIHPKKPEKLRMVLDGAAKVKSVSLNSMLLTGPDELASLVDILRRLREKLIGIGGDIKEMFHQIKIKKNDQRYQLFLFRNGDTNKKPDVYAMGVMIFGSKCSPAAAQFVKNNHAKKYNKTHPRAVEAIINNHYVDDMMDGENSVERTIQLVKDVKMIHSRGGFEIRNFISNSSEVLQAIGANNTCDGKELSLHSELKTERVLGMWWNTKLDVFTFSLKYTLIDKDILEGKKMPTKRELLRTLMSIFDPLGLLSNYLIQLKILLQDVWRMDLNWDEQITCKNLITKWKQWLEYLPSVESVQVPRLYSLKLISEKQKTVETHIFVDASVDAFTAVIYLRVANEDEVDITLMGSKARVAPLKYLSIPRKELQSAVLGVRLMNSISQAQRFKVDRQVFWSDSETVLSWLKSDHKKYSPFVAHRVGEILDTTDVNEWRWIPTKENVADEGTKWSRSMNFKPSNRWFSGPEFLRLEEEKWPKKKIIKSDVVEEMKTHCVHASLVLPQIVDPKRFSKWNRMLRAVAYSLRFRNIFADKKCRGTPLSQDEIVKAEEHLFRQAQFEGFPSEMVTLIRNESLPLNKRKFIEKPSPLYDGTPYLDGNRIMRMRSRIDGARDLSENTKRPIILPKDSRITRLLVHHYHARYKHQNHNTVINEIRQRFYIPRIRVVLNSVRNNCQMCKVRLAKIMEPQMADLPPARLATFAKPFSYVGVDYFGPMKIKIGRRNEKRWGVLFTCLTIRAVHIELVSTLEAQSCIMAIRNFIADRGEVNEFHSDCGTHFTGANNELQQELKKLDLEKLQTEFTSSYTKWIFNPPASPHMGGSWERLIGSTKAGLYDSLLTRRPTEETLRNVLKEIQNIINSRPLTYIPLEIEEDEALTPNHFLHGSSNGMKPPCAIDVDGEYLRKSWKEAQRLAEIFWKRFVKEYLPTIARRTKWHKQVKPISKDDLVLVIDEKNPRNVYPRGRVLETRIGSNGQVRRARVELIAEAKVGSNGKICKVRKNDLWRPAHKLAVLDVLSKNEESLTKPSLDRKTGGRMLKMNVNTGFRRSPRIAKRSGNTVGVGKRQANARKKN